VPIARKRPRLPDHGSKIKNHKSIKALFFDVDGVLTDGRVYLSDDGREFKVFDTKDGHGMKKAIAAGLKVAWISGRTSRATARRARELGVRDCRQGVRDKLAVYRELCRRWRLRPEETAAVGDDEPDVPLLEAAGFSACPADATRGALDEAQLVLSRCGGRGAAREFIERVFTMNGSPSPARSIAGGRSARRRDPRRAPSGLGRGKRE
jgi:3-deoxy-D-manno-octulosonate 8-phosphate phosphatase (KDO 8-P phosphatase)